MRLRLLSTHDNKGGAANACLRLHKGLLKIGCDSRLLVRWKQSDVDHVDCTEEHKSLLGKSLTYTRSLIKRLPAIWHAKKDCELFSLASGPLSDLSDHCQNYAIVNLHWCVSTFDLPLFFARLSPQTKVVLTLHDMNYFTGGCHYSCHCRRYEADCGNCHWLKSPSENDLSRRNYLVKKEVFNTLNVERICIVSPSNWLSDCASSSSLLKKFRIETIPYGVETDVFVPSESSDFRRRYEISDAAKTVLFVADSLTNRRKGIDLLLDSLNNLSDIPLVVIALGDCSLQHCDIPPNVKLIAPGYFQNQSALAEAYCAADLFVIPSRQDNLPNTVLESLACGTPVVGFNVGGIPDMVRQGETGFLAQPNDPADLAKAIKRFFSLTDAQNQKIRAKCREVALEEYSLLAQARAYKTLFEQLVGDSRN